MAVMNKAIRLIGIQYCSGMILFLWRQAGHPSIFQLGNRYETKTQPNEAVQ